METETKIPWKKPRSEWTPDQLAAKRAYDARSQQKVRDRKRAEQAKAEGWTRERAFTFLKSQGLGVYPETEWVLDAIWLKYREWNRLYDSSQMPRYFEFRDEDGFVNDGCAVLWPTEVFDCIFGEIAAGVIAPNTLTELHVVRELAKAIKHRDVAEGDSIRSYYTSVWKAWAAQGFPLYNRVAYPTKFTPCTPPAGWNGDIVHDGYQFGADADKLIDVSTLKPFHPLIAEIK